MLDITTIIADDSMFMRMVLRKMLEEIGCEIVAEAEDGLEAVELSIVHKPKLVTMDLTMPNLSGIEAIRQIKQTLPNTGIIVCSAMGQQTMVLEALQAGALDFIVKPFHKSRVAKAIKDIKALLK